MFAPWAATGRRDPAETVSLAYCCGQDCEECVGGDRALRTVKNLVKVSTRPSRRHPADWKSRFPSSPDIWPTMHSRSELVAMGQGTDHIGLWAISGQTSSQRYGHQHAGDAHAHDPRDCRVSFVRDACRRVGLLHRLHSLAAIHIREDRRRCHDAEGSSMVAILPWHNVSGSRLHVDHRNARCGVIKRLLCHACTSIVYAYLKAT